nr:hypothetical protein [Talaromyces amestolkiae polymycovirus 1]
MPAFIFSYRPGDFGSSIIRMKVKMATARRQFGIRENPSAAEITAVTGNPDARKVSFKGYALAEFTFFPAVFWDQTKVYVCNPANYTSRGYEPSPGSPQWIVCLPGADTPEYIDPVIALSSMPPEDRIAIAGLRPRDLAGHLLAVLYTAVVRNERDCRPVNFHPPYPVL